MSISPAKVYRLRVYLITGIPGSFAINDDHNNPIRLSPVPPDVFEKANWRLLPAHDQEGVYQISFDHPGPGLPVVWDVPEHPEPGSPVIASPSNLGKGWIIRPIGNGVRNAYTIRPNIQMVGAELFAGPDVDGSRVVFKVLPIDVPDEDKFYWVLDPVDLE